MAELQRPQYKAPYLLSLISQQKLDPSRLSRHDIHICIRFLLQDKKHSQQEIAVIMKVDPATVTRAKYKMLADNSWMLDQVDERKFAIDMINTAMNASARLFRKGKEREAWQALNQPTPWSSPWSSPEWTPEQMQAAAAYRKALSMT